MQFQVPQFIETEDKVVGPLSLRQFLYIGIGGIVCAVMYFLVATWLFFVISFFIMGGAIALAFVRVNGQPFLRIATAAADFYWKPHTYTWRAPETIQPAQSTREPGGISLEKIAAGLALHKSWENLQTGVKPAKTSDREFIEKRMNERYQIFQKVSGDRQAAKRVDYR